MNNNPLRTAVVGVGYLGNFHAEKYANLPNSQLIAVSDNNSARCEEIAAQYHCQTVPDYQQLIGQVDAVSIVVPTLLHFEVAKCFLENGIHVLLEKPITKTAEEAQTLIDIANEKQLVFQIGHLERFNSVLKAVSDQCDNPRFIDSSRLAPFKLRGSDVCVILDLMIHDIDIIQSLVKSPIQHIAANGACVLSNKIDIANARITFENGCVANVTASRVSLKTERKLRIFQHDGYLSLDLHHKKLAHFRKGEKEMLPGIPEIVSEEQTLHQGDALLDEIAAFLEAIQTGGKPLVSGEDGKRALETAIEITRVIDANSS